MTWPLQKLGHICHFAVVVDGVDFENESFYFPAKTTQISIKLISMKSKMIL